MTDLVGRYTPWFACPLSRLLVAPGLLDELGQVGVRVVDGSDCYSEGRAVISTGDSIVGKNYSLDLKLGDGWAVLEPIDDNHARAPVFVDRRVKVEKVLLDHDIKPIIATQEQYAEYVQSVT